MKEQREPFKGQIIEIIRRRSKLKDREWSLIEENPKFQQPFQNALEASKHRVLAEVIGPTDVIQGMLSAKSLFSIAQVISLQQDILFVSATF